MRPHAAIHQPAQPTQRMTALLTDVILLAFFLRRAPCRRRGPLEVEAPQRRPIEPSRLDAAFDRRCTRDDTAGRNQSEAPHANGHPFLLRDRYASPFDLNACASVGGMPVTPKIEPTMIAWPSRPSSA